MIDFFIYLLQHTDTGAAAAEWVDGGVTRNWVRQTTDYVGSWMNGLCRWFIINFTSFTSSSHTLWLNYKCCVHNILWVKVKITIIVTRVVMTCSSYSCCCYLFQGDIFSGLNDGLLSRAEALAAADIGKHQSSHVHSQMTSQLKHDMYHHGMSAPPQRPLQVSFKQTLISIFYFLIWFVLIKGWNDDWQINR